jgi:hypothetical protein
MAPALKKSMMPLFLLFFGVDMRSSVSLTFKLPTLMFMASLSESADKTGCREITLFLRKVTKSVCITMLVGFEIEE